jgi:hypothetical protein
LHQLQSSKEASAKPISLKKNIKTNPQLIKTTTSASISTTTTTTVNSTPSQNAQKQPQQQQQQQKQPQQQQELPHQHRTSILPPNSTALLHQQMKNLKINSMKITATKSSIGTNTAATISSSNGINTNITTTTTVTGNRKITINKIIQQTQAPQPAKQQTQQPQQPRPTGPQIKVQQQQQPPQQTMRPQPQQQQNIQRKPNENSPQQTPIVARPKKEVTATTQTPENFLIRPKNIQQLSAISAQQAQQLKHLQEVREKLMIAANTPNTTTINTNKNKTPQIRGDAPLEDILKFIEGSDDDDKSAERKESKRDLKKAKLKVKKEERKKLEQLEETQLRYEILRFQESEAQKEVNLYKNVNRKKDKLKFLAGLENLKRLRGNMAALEEQIDEHKKELKEINPNFDMSLNNKPPPVVQQQQATQQQQLHPQYNNKGNAKVQQQQQQQQPNSLVNQISVDPAKRLVTIKRIELPNSEPQVTVTAKGTSPDKDQLLGTFVNGQLIPPHVAVSKAYQNYQQQAAAEAAKRNKNNKNKVTTEPTKMSEKQIKAAKKEASKLEKLMEKQNVLAANAAKVTKKQEVDEPKTGSNATQEVAKNNKKGE